MNARRPAREDERSLRQQCVRICELIYERGYSTGTDGNISVRLGERHLLTTPSGAHKGFLHPDDLVKTDRRGKPVAGQRGAPTSEIAMHTAVYDVRPDVRALVHAHPAAAIAVTLAGIDLETIVVPEVIFGIGNIPTVPYSTPTTLDVPREVLAYAEDNDGMILERHGTLTMGSDLLGALAKLETIEHTARIVLLARAVGPVQPLADEEVARLRRVAGRSGSAPDEATQAVIARATAQVLELLSGGRS